LSPVPPWTKQDNQHPDARSGQAQR